MAPNEECKVYRCSFTDCDKTYKKKLRLDRHIRTHTGERPYICPHDNCEKSFACRTYLNKHIKRPHADESTENIDKQELGKILAYGCDCGKFFKTRFELKTHRATHTGEKPFKCHQCDSAFAMRSRLLRHQKRHRGYPCEIENCETICDTWTALRRHVSEKHKQIPRCEICERTFSNASNLRIHMGAHKFRCEFDDCDKSFAKKCHLKQHVVEQHQVLTFACGVVGCVEKFANSLLLLAHEKKHEREKNIENDKTEKEHRAEERKRRCPITRKTIMAQVLSNYEATESEINDLKQQDKLYRQLIKV